MQQETTERVLTAEEMKRLCDFFLLLYEIDKRIHGQKKLCAASEECQRCVKKASALQQLCGTLMAIQVGRQYATMTSTQ